MNDASGARWPPLKVYTSGVDSIELQSLIERHFREWELTVTSERMRFRGWWISGSVQVTLEGLRGDVFLALRAFVNAAMAEA